MNSHIFATAVLIAQLTPAPAQTPLHEIGHVHASSLCATLRGHVRPAVAAMMNNDQLIGATHRGFAKVSHDISYGSDASVQFDQYYLRQVEERLAHNLQIIDSIMKRPTSVPDDQSPDGREAADLNVRLAAVLKSQKDALNLLSGTLDTEAMGRMQGEISNDMKSVTGQSTSQSIGGAAPGAPSFLGTAGLPTDPSSSLAVQASAQPTIHGHNIYDTILENLDAIQLTTARQETQATAAVLASVDACKSSSTTPDIAPSQSPAP